MKGDDAAAWDSESDATDAEPPIVVGCDAGATASGCGFLNVKLQGGLTASDCCYACGADVQGFSWSIDQDLASFDISFAQGQTPLERTGMFPLDFVSITTHADGGALVQWKTPPGACTVTITRSVCVLGNPGGAQDWLNGSGHCTKAAEPGAGNSAAPVTIGDFTFRGYVLMP